MCTLCPSWADELRLFDATPLPCGRSRETVKRSALAGLANYGYCASHSRWCWGLKLYLLTTTEGTGVYRGDAGHLLRETNTVSTAPASLSRRTPPAETWPPN